MQKFRSAPKFRYAVAFAGLAALTSGVALAASDDPFGVWTRPSTGTQVQFYDCGGKLCGKIVAVKDQSKASTVGTVIMAGATKTGDNQWKGDLLNTEDGKTYSGKVSLDDKGLKLEGCVAVVICKGETWTKSN